MPCQLVRLLQTPRAYHARPPRCRSAEDMVALSLLRCLAITLAHCLGTGPLFQRYLWRVATAGKEGCRCSRCCCCWGCCRSNSGMVAHCLQHHILLALCHAHRACPPPPPPHPPPHTHTRHPALPLQPLPADGQPLGGGVAAPWADEAGCSAAQPVAQQRVAPLCRAVRCAHGVCRGASAGSAGEAGRQQGMGGRGVSLPALPGAKYLRMLPPSLPPPLLSSPPSSPRPPM